MDMVDTATAAAMVMTMAMSIATIKMLKQFTSIITIMMLLLEVVI